MKGTEVLVRVEVKSDQGIAFAETAEKALAEALQTRGFPPDRAKEVAERVRETCLAHAQ